MNIFDTILPLLPLIFAGIFTGTLSGFFGIGGGTILVPILIFLGFDIKDAIRISVIQMLMASLSGSYLNNKNGLIDLKLIFPIGFGGFLGAIGSSIFVSKIDSFYLELLFLTFLSYAFIQVARKGTYQSNNLKIKLLPHWTILTLIGIGIGFFAISIGIGGSLLLVPILVGFFNYDIKKAIATGLFFVIFSSLSGVINFSLQGHIQYFEALIVGTSSLIGVVIGIQLGKLAKPQIQKRLLLFFYGTIFLSLAYKILGARF
jgi:uncharacterized membrane protein YfcA